VIDSASVRHVHILGICGTAMGAFAGLLKALGFQVTGSDSHPYPPMSTQLERQGIPVFNGYSPTNLEPRPDLVVIGNVIRQDNPEAVEVLAKGIPYTSMPAALAELCIRDQHSLVVAGTHGKTTTSALLAWCLHHAGYNPGFLIGGELINFGRNFGVGKPGFFVVEGDEYDTAFFDKGPKFLHYRPRSAIITSVEFDHADIYTDIRHVKSSFKQFLELVPPDGRIIACTDYEHLESLLIYAKTKPITYALRAESDYSGFIEETGPEGMRFVITRGGGGPIANLHTPLYGKHNLLNVIAVTLLLRELGLSVETIQGGLATFKGVKRRQEVFAEINGITLIDDFAHHPTAVQVTIDAVRARYPGRRLWAVFEPRSNTTRRRVFQERFNHVFGGADKVLIADVYKADDLPEEERFSPRELADTINACGGDARALSSVDEIIDTLFKESQPGDVILIMSNGGFGGLYKKLPAALSVKADSSEGR